MSFQKFDRNKIIFFLLVIAAPFVGTSFSLITGVLFGVILANPYTSKIKPIVTKLLQLAIVLMGTTLSFSKVMESGKDSIGLTFISLVSIFAVGFGLRKILNVEKISSLLITAGTAICGGSAIAAVGPVLGAQMHQMTVSLAVVFLLNAAGLWLFPFLGHLMHLTPEFFGTWAALSIHDTSSVVGAALEYGDPITLATATTVKLTRTLWIIPMTFVLGLTEKKKGNATFPVFIFGFLGASLAFSFLPVLSPVIPYTGMISKKIMAVVLFLIGSSLNVEAIKKVGFRPVLFGVLLWAYSAVSHFWLIRLLFAKII